LFLSCNLTAECKISLDINFLQEERWKYYFSYVSKYQLMRHSITLNKSYEFTVICTYNAHFSAQFYRAILSVNHEPLRVNLWVCRIHLGRPDRLIMVADSQRDVHRRLEYYYRLWWSMMAVKDIN